MQQCKNCETIYITEIKNCPMCNKVEGDYTDIFRVQGDQIFEPLEISKAFGTYKYCDTCQMYLKTTFNNCPRCNSKIFDRNIQRTNQENDIEEGVISSTIALILYDLLKFLLKLPFKIVKSFLDMWKNIKKKRSDFIKLVFNANIELEAVGLNTVIVAGVIASADGVDDTVSKDLLDRVKSLEKEINSAAHKYNPQKASMDTVKSIKKIRVDWVDLAKKIKPFEYPELSNDDITRFIREVLKFNK